MKLFTEQVYDLSYVCIDLDRYDGAPDANALDAMQGFGKTAQEAEADYKDRKKEYLDWHDLCRGCERKLTVTGECPNLAF